VSYSSGYKNRDLLIKLRKGHSGAFRQIFDLYQEKLILYSVGIVKDDGVGKDIVQETFIKLWINRGELDPEKSLSGYLHTICRNLALNHLKRAGYDQDLKKRIWNIIEYDQQRVKIEEDIFARESQHIVNKAVGRLSPQRQYIFLLSREKGMTHKEIGMKLGISKNTVKNQMVSALKEIRSHLKQNTDIALFWFFVFLSFGV
jgi:RNA polymerase sigma-70 factor (family 1)